MLAPAPSGRCRHPLGVVSNGPQVRGVLGAIITLGACPQHTGDAHLTWLRGANSKPSGGAGLGRRPQRPKQPPGGFKDLGFEKW